MDLKELTTKLTAISDEFILKDKDELIQLISTAAAKILMDRQDPNNVVTHSSGLAECAYILGMKSAVSALSKFLQDTQGKLLATEDKEKSE